MDKVKQIRDFIAISLQEDVSDLRDISVKRAALNIGLGVIMLLVVALHLVLSFWQLAVSILLVGYDLIDKGLTKLMPAPKS